MKKIIASICIGILFLLALWWKFSFGFPILCTSHGCVTTSNVSQETIYQEAFAKATGSSTPTKEALLTTLLRRHLITTRGNTRITTDDAVRYRTNILHLTDEAEVRKIGFSSLNTYDTLVTIPFLMQEAYIHEHSLKSPEDAYKKISEGVTVLSLLFDYTWDSSKGEVVLR